MISPGGVKRSTNERPPSLEISIAPSTASNAYRRPWRATILWKSDSPSFETLRQLRPPSAEAISPR